VAEVARTGAAVAITPAAIERATAAADAARRIAGRRPIYGRTTGVGANRGIDVGDDEEHGLRLLRSHAGGAGPLLPPDIVRAMLTVRLNQLAAGGSGADPALLGALADVLNTGVIPPIPAYGAIGTGDLTALAATALCLIGERDFLPAPVAPGGPDVGPMGAARGAVPVGVAAGVPRVALRPSDAPAFMSSNAATLGESALACHDLAVLVRAAIPVAALSLLAVHGSAEPFAEAVAAARPHPGQRTVADLMRGLLAESSLDPWRIQDPYGYRTFPQVHGPALDAVESVARIVTTEINAAAENPLVDVAGDTVWHNGNFHSAYAGLALDAARAAFFQTAALSAARLGTLVEPAFTGLAPFQADTERPSSGIMILEYVAHSAIADIRRLAAPAALGSAVLSRGVEEHAGFATQSARATTETVEAYRVVVACELVASVRALRLWGHVPEGPLRTAFEVAAEVLDPRIADRPLDGDIAAAVDVLPRLAVTLPS
jgi:histidine ammonia-lyase